VSVLAALIRATEAYELALVTDDRGRPKVERQAFYEITLKPAQYSVLLDELRVSGKPPSVRVREVSIKCSDLAALDRRRVPWCPECSHDAHPRGACGSSCPCTCRAVATAEACYERSADGHCVTFAGAKTERATQRAFTIDGKAVSTTRDGPIAGPQLGARR
jgi:hypothetical protein